MELRLLTASELAAAYHTDLTEAFPPSELKPLSAMEALRSRGLYDPLCLFDDDGSAMGYLLLWNHLDGRYHLIDYLCVPARRRNGGIGARLLRMTIDRYPASAVFLGESEAPTGDPARDEMILRRLGFYRRCGAHTLGYDCALFGVHFKTICWAEPMPPEEEILRKHQEIYLNKFGRERYERFIQLPLRPGEAIHPVTDWTED